MKGLQQPFSVILLTWEFNQWQVPDGAWPNPVALNKVPLAQAAGADLCHPQPCCFWGSQEQESRIRGRKQASKRGSNVLMSHLLLCVFVGLRSSEKR